MSRRRSTLTVNDMFCGAGGSSIGAVAAGAELKRAFNHWRQAIDTHAANFRDADHVCADIHSTDPRRFEATDILLASPECTNHSLAKSKAKPMPMPLFDEPDEAADRSRATMWCVVRFAEHHRYRLVIVENVVEALRWEPFGAWLAAMTALGYEHRIVSLNSFAAPPTPQSRDRLYIVFWRKGNRAPDLDIRVPAWCPKCERVVQAFQSFKNPKAPWGKYRTQYVYRCDACREVAFPFVAPASTAIDWTLRGERIGDRARPLKPATIRRIEEGLRRYARPMLAQVGGHSFAQPPSQMAPPHHGLVVPLSHVHSEKVPTPTSTPFPTQTARQDMAFVTELRGGSSDARPVSDPLSTVTAGGNHHALIFGAYGGNTKDGGTRPVSEPVTPITANDHHALLVPYYGTGVAHPVSEPVGTVTATDRHALLGPAPAVEDCEFRMLEPHEIQAAMAFPAGYIVLGNKRARVRQLGNAVTPPAMSELIRRCVESLDGSPA